MAVKQEKCSIQSADDFHRWTMENNSSKIRYISYSETDLEVAKSKLSSNEPAIAVPGTMKIHAVARADETSIFIRNTSCYCKNCTNDVSSTDCTGCESRIVVKQQTRQTEPPTATTNDDQGVGDQPIVMNSNEGVTVIISLTSKESPEANSSGGIKETTSSHEMKSVLEIDKLDWVAVEYESDWYVGQVTDIDENELFINFLTAAGNFKDQYKFPNPPDKVWVWKSDVIMKIETLVAVGKSKRLYKINEEERKQYCYRTCMD